MGPLAGKKSGYRADGNFISSFFCCRCLSRSATRAWPPLQRRHFDLPRGLPRELPLGWESAWDPVHQHVYYFNRGTGERTWSEPWKEEAPGYADDRHGEGALLGSAPGCEGAYAASASAVGAPGTGGLDVGVRQVVKMSESKMFRLEVMDTEGRPSTRPVITAFNVELQKSSSSRSVKMWVESRAASGSADACDRSRSPDSCSIASGSHAGGASSTCTTRPPNSVSMCCLPDADSTRHAPAGSAKACDSALAGAMTKVAEDADANLPSARSTLGYEQKNSVRAVPHGSKGYSQPDSIIQMYDQEGQVLSPWDAKVPSEDDNGPRRERRGSIREPTEPTESTEPTPPARDSEEATVCPSAAVSERDGDAPVPEGGPRGAEEPAAGISAAGSGKRAPDAAEGRAGAPGGGPGPAPSPAARPEAGGDEAPRSALQQDGGSPSETQGACCDSDLPELHGVSSKAWDGRAQGKEDVLRCDKPGEVAEAPQGTSSWPSPCWREERPSPPGRARGRPAAREAAEPLRALEGAGARSPSPEAGAPLAFVDAACRSTVSTSERQREEAGDEREEFGALEAGIRRPSLNTAMLIMGFECGRAARGFGAARPSLPSVLRAASPGAFRPRTASLPPRRGSSPLRRPQPPWSPRAGSPPRAAQRPGHEAQDRAVAGPGGRSQALGQEPLGESGGPAVGVPAAGSHPRAKEPGSPCEEEAAAAVAATRGAHGRSPVPELELGVIECSASSGKEFEFQSVSGRDDSPSSFQTASNSSASRSRFSANQLPWRVPGIAPVDAEDNLAECNRSVNSIGADTSCVSWQTATEHMEGRQTPQESRVSQLPNVRQPPTAGVAQGPPPTSTPMQGPPPRCSCCAVPVGGVVTQDQGGKALDPAESPAAPPQVAAVRSEADDLPGTCPPAGQSASAGKGAPPRKGEPPRKGSGKGVPPGKGAPPAPGKGGGALGKGKGKAEPLKPDVMPRIPLKKLFWNPISLEGRPCGPQPPEETVWRRIHAEGARFDAAELEELFSEMLAPPEVVERPRVEDVGGAGCAAPRGSRLAARRRRALEERRRRQLWFMLALMPELDVLLAAVERMDGSTLGPESLELLVLNLPNAEEALQLRLAAEVPLQEEEVWDTPEDFVLRLTNIPEYELRVKVWSFLNSFDPICSKLKAAAGDVATACDVLRNSERVQQLLALVLYVGNYLNGGTPRGRADGFDVETLPKLSAVKASVALRREGNRGGGNLLDFLVRQMEREYPGVLPHLYEENNEVEWVHRARRHKLAEVGDELARLLTQAQDYHGRLKQQVAAADPLVGCVGETHACIVRLNDLSSSLGEVQTKYLSLASWFHMDTQRLRPTDEFFALWDTFFLDLKRALDAAVRPARPGPGPRSTTPRLRTEPHEPPPGHGDRGAGARERGWTPPRRSAPALLARAAPGACTAGGRG